MGPLEEGPGPGIEDAAAVAALVIQDRGPVAVVDPEPLPLPAAGAGQSLGVEQLDELAVAGVLVHGVVQGEVHRWALLATRCISYEPNPFRTSRQGAEHGIGPMSQEGMELPGDFLERTGYRLPTEGEWGYACRAGAVSSRPYGRSEGRLASYAWFLTNSSQTATMHPAGGLKPNDLGLFDILGNAYEWCNDPYTGAYKPDPGDQA